MTHSSPDYKEVESERAGLFRAGKVAIWVWVVLALVPVVVIVACCVLCSVGGIVGSVLPTATPTP